MAISQISCYSSARGNTTLESAVSLTKSLRWDIQKLGIRIDKAASTEETSRQRRGRLRHRVKHEAELRFIIQDIRQLLIRIEDAVPLINLAITTSGASLSTTLPHSVSPSRLLQASTLLTVCDRKFAELPTKPAQVGPDFILSIYMLFTGHIVMDGDDNHNNRHAAWKEVIHKARVKLMRVPLATMYDQSSEHIPVRKQSSNRLEGVPHIQSGLTGHVILDEEQANDYGYQLEIIEDLDDDRAHSFDDCDLQPGPYKDVSLAGIREILPIHEISKIFYADTGKILNIGNAIEANSPILLLKRDINASPPRRMMERAERGQTDLEEHQGNFEDEFEHSNPQDDIDNQLRRESSVPEPEDFAAVQGKHNHTWRFPADLDPEWLALEVYNEPEDSSSDDGQSGSNDSICASDDPSHSQEPSVDPSVTLRLENLNLDDSAARRPLPQENKTSPPLNHVSVPSPANMSRIGPIRTSLSLLEMLIRLSSLQQFQQVSHLSIPDELLVFFLEESSTTGAGGDGEERQRKRQQAREKVGFDPYDESPIKRRGEGYQIHNHGHDRVYSRSSTPYDDLEAYAQYEPHLRHRSDHRSTLRESPESWMTRNIDDSFGSGRAVPSSHSPSSPTSPSVPPKRIQRFLGHSRKSDAAGSGVGPSGRGVHVDAEERGDEPGSTNDIQ